VESALSGVGTICDGGDILKILLLKRDLQKLNQPDRKFGRVKLPGALRAPCHDYVLHPMKLVTRDGKTIATHDPSVHKVQCGQCFSIIELNEGNSTSNIIVTSNRMVLIP